MDRMVRRIVSVLLLLNLTVASASAAEPSANDLVKDELHLQATFSFWATSVDGSVAVSPLSASFDECFTELIQHADYAFNPSVELSKGRWTFAFNMTISKVSQEQATLLGLSDIDAEATIAGYQFLIGYTALAKQLDNGMTLMITPAAGAQLTTSDTKINPALLPSVQENVTFVDPVIGGRITLGLTPKLDWRIEGLVGGFGVGSDLTWSAGTFLDWKFARNFELNFGYRAIYWDYDLGSADVDLLLYGPYLGLTWEIF